VRTEWSDRFRAASIAVAASLWAAFFGVLGSGLGQLGDPWSPVLPALVGPAAGVAFGWPAFRARRWVVGAHRVVTWSAVAGWVAWVYVAGADQPLVWQVWGYGSLGLALVSLPFAVPDAGPGWLPSPAAGPGKYAEWVERIERLAPPVKAPRVQRIVAWSSGFGHDVIGEFSDGSTWQALAGRAANFASDLQLPHGCSVTVGPAEAGGHRGGFVVKVNTRDAMSTPRRYLEEFPRLEPLSINGPIPFGYSADGSHAAAEMRQRCAFVTGEVGSGKTCLIENLNAGLVRCPDVFLIHVDLNGGDMPRQWVTPWIEGRAERPAVQWPAVTVDEAVLATEFAVECALARKTVYAADRRAANTRLLPVSAEVPLVMVVVDEGAETTGLDASKYLRANLTRAVELGRAMGVRVLFCALRSTSEIVPKQLLVQMGLRIGMAVSEQAEVGRLFDWPSGVDPADIPYVGSGRWRDGSAGPLRPFRSWHADEPQTIDEIAVRCAHLRPDMDGRTLAAIPVRLREAYETRWSRIVPAIVGESHAGAPVRETAAVSSATGRSVVAPSGDMGEDYDGDAVDRAIRRARAVQAHERLRQMPAEYAEREFARLAEAVEDERARGETPRAGRVDPRARMLQLLDAAGAEGVSGPRLLELLDGEGLSVPQTSLYRWLSSDATKLGYGRYVHPKHRPAEG
jgi:S-DNA-T family DNA segregation ATPase FtsK/SpoIIIE